jgi:hypothetical protein
MDQEIFLVILFGGFLAENATVRGARRLNVLVAPRAPEVVHNRVRAA